MDKIFHIIVTVDTIYFRPTYRYIGITGYDIGVLKRIVSMVPPNTIDTVLSYCRYNLLNKGAKLSMD